jgi:hypothetical protein
MNTQRANNEQIEMAKATDFLTPAQRQEAIAQILATIALRILKVEDEQTLQS